MGTLHENTTARVFTNIAELATPAEILRDAALVVAADGTVAWHGERAALPAEYASWPTHDLEGAAVVPGLVDAHTHLIWAGDRLDEYVLRSQGASYEEILESGGGIHNTTRATQAASEADLLRTAKQRAEIFLRGGVTSLEVKSGYGMTLEAELKMLRVAKQLADEVPQRIVPTFLAHVVPHGEERAPFVDMVVKELIPEVARQELAVAVDVFCDRGAYTLAEARRVLETAKEHGLEVKAHAEQLSHTGVSRLVAELGGLSADHLEQVTPEDWEKLAEAGTVGTVLPGATILLHKPFPPARAMWDDGVKVAVATDHNPGSSPFYSLALAMQLAQVHGGLSAPEALLAGTAHAADALGRSELGRLAPGSAADFLVLHEPRAYSLLYRWGHVPLRAAYIAGTCRLDLASALA